MEVSLSKYADMKNPEQFSLEDKYKKSKGRIILSGIQALVRLPLDQHEADKQIGLRTATFISGYRGSPLGGLDITLIQNKKQLQENNIKVMTGVNEDLAATAVFGAQIANLLPDPKFDGVLGMWYGKSPGVDRSGDALRHANFVGVGQFGGVLAVTGDDPISKSSTLPSYSEVTFFDLQIPLLYPGNIQEIITFGRYGFELSRYTGLWVGLKIVTDIADGFGTADVTPIEVIKPEFEYEGKPWKPTQNPNLLPPFSLQQEKELVEARLVAAKLFAGANDLNKIIIASQNDKIGIISAGKTYYDIREALILLGMNDEQLGEAGIRILKLGLIYPLEPTIIQAFSEGLDEIIVIEEKRGFIEMQVKEILYNQPIRPKIIGKENEEGEILVPASGELIVDDIKEILLECYATRIPKNILEEYLRKQDEGKISLPLSTNLALIPRTPYFCSGCPHNSSTVVPDASIALGGIGCHALVLTMQRDTIGLIQMGGEGVSWVGAESFSGLGHMFQNLGDGTLFHSGYLAIRQSVAAGTNMTYKILYNSAVAMTGGQPVDGMMPVPELTRALEAEGVKQIIICADDPKKYPRRARWGKNVKVWHRDKLDEAQLILRDTAGTTVLIYDQPCAIDLRRKRKRGLASTPKKQVFINERICEGCGDCGVKSNCLSVFPVETRFGRKTQIHQASCNRDYTCLKGDCPAFVTIESDNTFTSRYHHEILRNLLYLELSEPDLKGNGDANIFMIGIGGTGVVTANQILATGALLDGKNSSNLDQTGLSQKGGPVTSHLKVRKKNIDISNRIPLGETSTLLIFDLLNGSTDMNLKYANPSKTIAVVSRSEIPTGTMVRDNSVSYPNQAPMIHHIERYTLKERNVYLDSISLAEAFFGTHMPANIITIGAAYQAGLIPISAVSIVKAIELNGVAVEINKQAFVIGRLIVHDADNILANIELHRPGSLDDYYDIVTLNDDQEALVASLNIEGNLERAIALRIQELTKYQNFKYSKRYVDFLRKVKMADISDSFELTRAVALYLYKLMAYKDEFEVARLYLEDSFTQELEKQFGKEFKVNYQLHPPIFRSLGLKNKIGFGKWFRFGFRLLHKMRFIRGTKFDFFGYSKIRRLERQLITDYQEMILANLDLLTEGNYDKLIELAELPDIIRGYEHIKEQTVENYNHEKSKLMDFLIGTEA